MTESAPDASAITTGLSQLCKTLDGTEWVMGRLDISGKGYTHLGAALKPYRHLRFLDARGNELGSTEKMDGEGENAEEESAENAGDENADAAAAEEGGEAAAEAPAGPPPHPLDALTGLTSLLALNLRDNGVLTLPEGLLLPNVQIADLAGNRLMSAPLGAASAPALVSLDVSNNALADATGFSGLNALRVLTINGNTVITTLADLGELPALERLSAKDCGLTDTNGLEGLSSACKNVDFSGNQIGDLSGFATAAASLSGLKTLNLSGNALDSLDQLESLAKLSALTDIDLSDTPIADTDAFKTEVVLRLPGVTTISGEAVTDEDRDAAKELKAQRKAEAEAAAAAEAEAEAEEDE